MTGLRSNLVAALLAAVFVFPGASAQAADCTLKEVVQLPVTKLAIKGNRTLYTVPVMIAGASERMALGIGTVGTAVTRAYVDRHHLSVHDMLAAGHVGFWGQKANLETHLSNLTLGPAVDSDAAVTVLPDKFAPGVTGVLGQDVLSHFDLELNLAAGWIRLFSQDHCPGTVVYWGRPFVAVDLHKGQIGQLQIKARLDGDPVLALVNLIRPSDQMTLKDARRVFGLQPDAAGMKLELTWDKERVYSYPFSTLSLNGYVLTKPTVVINEYTGKNECNAPNAVCRGGDEQLEIGASDLSRMRLYFAYGEKKLYITDPDPVTASQPGAEK